MKRMKKVKKMIMSIAIAIMLLPGKIVQAIAETGVEPSNVNRDVYDGVLPLSSRIWFIAKIYLMPLALIIGLIIYFKKSKNTTKRKIITIILVLLIFINVWILFYEYDDSAFYVFFLKTALLWIIFIIGSIIFFCKSKKSIKDKMSIWLLTFFIIAIFALIFCEIDYIIFMKMHKVSLT